MLFRSVKRGKRVQRKKKYFPGYVLIKSEMDNNIYHMIKNILELHSFKGWLITFLMLGLVVVFLPLLNIWLPENSILHVPDYMFSLIGKYLCYALVALAMDLIWGYTGILSLGHGVFFSIGGYAMGMYLMRSIGKEGVYKSDLPDFMVFLDWKELPWYWYATSSPR